jgi:C-3',4' desaturase CrtD
MQFDVAIVGAGIAGMATAARLQSAGLSTIVCEAHSRTGGCAGYFCRRGFSFDVGATTLVDFEPGGVGGELLESIGMTPLLSEPLPGYVAWLPDRKIVLHRDRAKWAAERLNAFGNTRELCQFWRLLDDLSDVFWRASRCGIKMPIVDLADAWRAVRCIGVRHLPLVRYWNWTLGDALRHFRLRDHAALVGLLSMLIEDTVHSSVDEAPLINTALGATIRGAGLTRAEGGMRGFWRAFTNHYRTIGGKLQLGCHVQQISGAYPEFTLTTNTGIIAARQVVSAVPVVLTAKLAPVEVQAALEPFVARDRHSQGGAIVVFLGVRESDIEGQAFTHHQLLQDYSAALGNGNNMFVSVSSPGDTLSAPAGHRAVMISTHCELAEWNKLPPIEYGERKRQIGETLVAYARRVFPRLAERPIVFEVATPRSYEKFTSRPLGAVGGVRQCLENSNQRAVPHDIGCRGFWQAGDTTWPGLGTVACVLGSRIVAEGVLKLAMRHKIHARTGSEKRERARARATERRSVA